MTSYFKGTIGWSKRKSTASTPTSTNFQRPSRPTDAQVFTKNLTEENSFKVLLDVLEVLKCRVCKFVITLPVVYNPDGEVVCETCVPSDPKFPSQVFYNALNPTEESILTSVILAVPRECRYRECACVILPGDDHQVWCEFQDTSCRLCDWVGATRYIVSHVTTSHNLEIREMGEFAVTRELEHFYPNNELIISTRPVTVGNVFLWVITSVDHNEKEFINNYIPVPNGKHTVVMSVEIVFGDESSKTINSIKKELNLNPLYLNSTKNSIVFPLSMLDDYIDKDNSLRWKEVFTGESPL